MKIKASSYSPERTMPNQESGLEKSLPWHHDQILEEIEHKNSVLEDNASLHFFRAKFDDGIKLGINYCRPNSPITETSVVITPALSTGLHGRNANMQRKLAELGLPSILIGTPGGERDSFKDEIANFINDPRGTISELGAICLSKNAHYVQEIIKRNDLLDLDNKSMIGYGESRGAMTLLGNIASQDEYDIKIPYALAVAPCYPRPFQISKSLEFSGQVLNEIIGLRQLIGSLGINHVNTLNLSPKSVIYEIAHIPTLFNGDTGKFIPEVPKDQSLDIISFKNDISGQPEYWRNIFPKDEYPNIEVEIMPGSHLSIAKAKTFKLVIDRFSFIRECILNNDVNNFHLKNAV
ncbi:MAG: hypothetical protein WCG30_03615 [Candidatus Saccharibacteria bacterium]